VTNNTTPDAPNAPAYPYQPQADQGSYPQQPGYPQQASYGTAASPAYVTPPPTNALAIVAFVFSLLGSAIIPVILGHIALSQIKKRGERGTPFAIIALVLGYLEIVFWVIILVFVLGVLGLVAGTTLASGA